jgi:hypothetical protein
MDKLVNDIGNAIPEFKKIMEAQMPALEAEVNGIIKRNSKDEREIGYALDTLLSLQDMGIGQDLFIRLLEYYKTFDAEAAADYWRYFDEKDDVD